MDKTDRVDSDADEELLINIPFTGDVKLKGIVVIGGEDETHPDKVAPIAASLGQALPLSRLTRR